MPTTAPRGSRSCVQGNAPSWSNLVSRHESHLGASDPSLHTSPAQTPRQETQLCRHADSPCGPFPHPHQLEALQCCEPDHPNQSSPSRTKAARPF